MSHCISLWMTIAIGLAALGATKAVISFHVHVHGDEGQACQETLGHLGQLCSGASYTCTLNPGPCGSGGVMGKSLVAGSAFGKHQVMAYVGLLGASLYYFLKYLATGGKRQYHKGYLLGILACALGILERVQASGIGMPTGNAVDIFTTDVYGWSLGGYLSNLEARIHSPIIMGIDILLLILLPIMILGILCKQSPYTVLMFGTLVFFRFQYGVFSSAVRISGGFSPPEDDFAMYAEASPSPIRYLADEAMKYLSADMLYKLKNNTSTLLSALWDLLEKVWDSDEVQAQLEKVNEWTSQVGSWIGTKTSQFTVTNHDSLSHLHSTMERVKSSAQVAKAIEKVVEAWEKISEQSQPVIDPSHFSNIMSSEDTQETSPNEGERGRPQGWANLLVHFQQQKVDCALWAIRGLTMVIVFGYFIPLFSHPYNMYYKALAANAAINALRLHQRTPHVQMNRQFFASLLMEDSCHYLFYSLIFMHPAPITMVLLPIFFFALVHFASYSLTLLDCMGMNNLWIARFFISIVELHCRNILQLIAFIEVMLMPVTIVIIFTGRASLLTPFIYYRFLTLRYSSRRNPYSRKVFHDLRIHGENFFNKPSMPLVLRNIFYKLVYFIERFAPPMPPVQHPQ
ncbi:unnamed protein product [Darwinula stevensoni]|uniref:Uncharacterized protein n=1 Tax=Darwinula stevensoni TaxID=69355 RepID=A0A7R8X3T9_9CRUS|nr:unnamed protein product [Darwinula stevensoni]CAG0884884.1 unnamed protein product [Darwinula stevensoni]